MPRNYKDPIVSVSLPRERIPELCFDDIGYIGFGEYELGLIRSHIFRNELERKDIFPHEYGLDIKRKISILEGNGYTIPKEWTIDERYGACIDHLYFFAGETLRFCMGLRYNTTSFLNKINMDVARRVKIDNDESIFESRGGMFSPSELYGGEMITPVEMLTIMEVIRNVGGK